MYPESTGDSNAEMSQRVADSADQAMQSARATARDAMDGLSDTMQSVRDQAAATVERFRPQIDAMASYAKDEPTKALLIAAATGAGLMALVAMVTRSSRDYDVPSAPSLRKAADDTSDRWTAAARDSAGTWRQAAEKTTGQWRRAAADAADDASSRAEGMMSSARGAAHDAYEGLADTVEKWKDQAGPLVDRVRPQLQAVTGYAKDDPAKALLIAAAAGAALMGLMNARGR